MSYSIQVFLKNNSFSEEYAQEKHEGKDSPENIRYEWEDEFRLTDASDVLEIVRDQPFILAGCHPIHLSWRKWSYGNCFF